MKYMGGYSARNYLVEKLSFGDQWVPWGIIFAIEISLNFMFFLMRTLMNTEYS